MKKLVSLILALALTLSLIPGALAVGNRYDPNEDAQFFGSFGQNLGVRSVSPVDENNRVTITEGVSSVENADLDAYLKTRFGDDYDWEKIARAYVGEGAYVISGSRVINWDDYAALQPGEMADDTDKNPVEVGGRLYVHMKDPSSADKYYLLVSSSKSVEIGEPLFTDGKGGYGLLDDKYVSTHMATSLVDGGEYSYFAHDLGATGGKIGLQQAGSEGQLYIYVICESPADYYQRLANEAAGLEERLPGEDRPYMPANNTAASNGTWLNEWHNTKYSVSFNFNNSAAEGEAAKLTLADDYGLPVDGAALAEKAAAGRNGGYAASVNVDDLKALIGADTFTVPVSALSRDSSVNDGVIRTGGTEGDSNTRLGGYSGENVVVAKFEVTISTGKIKFAAARNEDVFGAADTNGKGRVVTEYFNSAVYYEDGAEIDLTIEAGEPWYVHTQVADTSGRGGFTNGLFTAEITGDADTVSFDAATGILTGLKAGTARIVVTAADRSLTNRQTGEVTGVAFVGSTVTLNITVK